MRIEIYTSDYTIPSDLFGQENPPPGQPIEVPGSATLTYAGMTIQESAGAPDVINLIVQFVQQNLPGVGVGVFSSWLYDKLKNRDVKKVRINRREVRPERQEI